MAHGVVAATLQRMYSTLVIDEAAIAPETRSRIGVLLASTLDDGPRYRAEGWRTLRPDFRALAACDAGDVVGHASGFVVPSRPDVRLYGLGDVAVEPRHRRRGIARRLCAAVTDEARRRDAGVLLAKTQPLRAVLADLGFQPVTRFDYYHEHDGTCSRHPDWMALVWCPHGTPVRLAEGDF
jgi:GNAT superfamily N-acetyltransferase